MEKELQEMFEQGITESYLSECTSITVVNERLGHKNMHRLQELNAVTKRDANPMPRIDDILDELGAAKCITALDLAKDIGKFQ